MNSQERLFTIFLRLQSGEKISKSTLAEEFSVASRTIQRDLSSLRVILEEEGVDKELIFDSSDNMYFLKGKNSFSKKDVLVISKILLENRAFNKEEINSLLERLLATLTEEGNREVKSIIQSEWFSYKSLTNDCNRIDIIWNISEMIRKEQMLEISYKPAMSNSKKHIIYPISLYYDSHYFYLVAYNTKYEGYRTFRLDRIENYIEVDAEKPNISYGKKYKDGDVRNYRVDAYEGNMIRIQLIYTGNVDIVFDQFPESKLLSEVGDDQYKIEIQTQNTQGLKRWLLGQGGQVKILSPQILIDEIQETLEKMIKIYKK